MKILLLSILVSITGTLCQASQDNLIGEYGLHLFFNETEFVDVLTFSQNSDQSLSGHMHVPNDFDGDIENIQLSGNDIEFELFVPKNQVRPEDLIFHYKGQFFGDNKQQLIGYVTLKGQEEFVASFVAFKRSAP